MRWDEMLDINQEEKQLPAQFQIIGVELDHFWAKSHVINTTGTKCRVYVENKCISIFNSRQRDKLKYGG